MSRVYHIQTSFNGGELSPRLRARIDQQIYDIGVAEMVGFTPLMEGCAEAMPGLIRIAAAKGPFRPIPFEYNATQGHVIEASNLAMRVYTNDGQVMDGLVPFELTTPYSYADVQTLTWHQSFDRLYLYHGTQAPQAFTRVAADDFAFEPVAIENGPFEPRNDDESITVTASGDSGTITLTSSWPIFAAGDVGGLFQMEVLDFGDVRKWDVGITVTPGQLLFWPERVYNVFSGTRTGTDAPQHSRGIEFDGIGIGTDINAKVAGGVQLEYVHDRFGLVKITGFTNATTVTAEVIRTIPGGVVSSGTWRWFFGAFSTRRGWPQCGVIWNQRHILFKDERGYASVAFDLDNFATYNEQGDISADMAFDFPVGGSNAVVQAVPDEKLIMLTAGGVFALGPSNAANGIGPGNWRVDSQSSDGAANVDPVTLDSRTLYVGRSKRRLFESDFEAARNVEDSRDMTRYARHIGTPKFTALASQKQPNNLLYASRDDGVIAVAAYLPNEQVMGWARRPLASGAMARGLCAITDPAGEFEQIWVAVEYGGAWHMCLQAPWREDGVARPTSPMLDLSEEYIGAPATAFAIAHLPDTLIQIVADGRVFFDVMTGPLGEFVLPEAAGHVVAGLGYPAWIKQLWTEKGGDSGPAMGRMTRISRAGVRVLDARGLQIEVSGGLPRDIEQLQGSSIMDEGYSADTGMRWFDDMGANTREPWVKVSRVAPVEATILAIAQHVEVQAA
jgi:hypothetical protein